MDKEERLKAIEFGKQVLNGEYWDGTYLDTFIALSVEALEQEPCEDAISREVACRYLARARRVNDSRPMKKIFAAIPSVTPKEKTGHWIFNKWSTICSECGFKKPLGGAKYCPECGSRMESEEC